MSYLFKSHVRVALLFLLTVLTVGCSSSSGYQTPYIISHQEKEAASNASEETKP